MRLFFFPYFFKVPQLLLAELSEDYSLVKGKVPCKRGITVTVDLLVDLSCSLEWNLETKTPDSDKIKIHLALD